MVLADTLDNYPSLQSSGIAFRTPTEGREKDLVLSYIDEHFSVSPVGLDITVFIEPKLECGFPDIVVAFMDPHVAYKWPESREQMRKADLKLLHYLVACGPGRWIRRERLLTHFDRKELEASLSRLHDAGMIRISPRVRSVRSAPMSEIFALRRLVAIEAKIHDWKGAFHQAVRNTWFSSETFVLLAGGAEVQSVRETGARLGVGVLSRHDSIDLAPIPARRDNLPKSYATWLFNEWAWRALVR